MTQYQREKRVLYPTIKEEEKENFPRKRLILWSLNKCTFNF